MLQPRTHIICLAMEMKSSIALDLFHSLDQHDWNYSMHTARDGWNLTQSSWKERGITLMQHSKLAQQPGAQGCLWSHMDLWELCASGGEPIIILESDALCLQPWKQSFRTEHDVVKLAYKFNNLRPNKRTGQWSPGSTGYYITPKGATLLLDYVRNTSALEADKLIGTHIVSWTHGDRLFDINTRSYTKSSTKSINRKDYERLIANK
jgi:GR25 family glycosyltransferase involved in LPS biosynthesis